MRLVFGFTALLLDILSWLCPLAVAAVAGVLVALLTQGIFLAARPAVLIAAFPLLYLLWLVLFVSISAIATTLIFRGFQKPRALKVDLNFNSWQNLRAFIDAVRILSSYRTGLFMMRLPVLNYSALPPLVFRWMNTLTLRAYSPATHIGKQSSIVSRPQDPDLTYVGSHVVIGSECTIVAHSIKTLRSGQLVFSSAPIEIEDEAVIGGGSYISPGVKVGKGAIVQMRSHLVPFTRIGPCEVWGGNPATFQRMVNEEESLAVAATSPPVTGDLKNASKAAASEVVTQITSQVIPAPSSADDASRNNLDVAHLSDSVESNITSIIAQAIYLSPEEITDELNSDNYELWDSMAQMSIASALFDRFSIDIPPENVFQLRSRPAIRQIISRAKAGDEETSLAHTDVDTNTDLSTGSEGAVSTATEKAAAVEPFELPTDPELLPLLEADLATQVLAHRYQSDSASPTARKALCVSTFTAQFLKSPLEIWSRAFNTPVSLEFLDFDQIEQTLLAESSPFTENQSGLNIVLVRPEDLISEHEISGMVRGQTLIQAIQSFTQRGSGLIVSNLPPLVSSFSAATPAQIYRLRAWWQEELEKIDGIQILDFAGVIEDLGRWAARDTALEVIARAPYSKATYQQLGIAIARLIRKTFLPAKKVLALDCDNTLWGGVVGEDGLEGIALSDDYPGRSFYLFQKKLLEYQRKGILLVLVSKNEAADVWRVFERHPDMVLRRTDIASDRINWQSKSSNLRALAEELNIGLDSIVFVDDSPTERLEVASNLPEVTVLPMPTEASQYVETLSKLWCFDVAALTAEDSKRNEYMRQEQARQSVQQSAASLESYLATLNLVVEIGVAAETDLPRVAQLTQKTNQFNLSLRRRSLSEIQQLPANKQVLTMRVKDRFGEYGLVGVAIVETHSGDRALTIETFLISCRVLGRGVEDAFLHVIFAIAADKELSHISAPFQTGPRNSQVKDFLLRSKFSEESSNYFAAQVQASPAAPEHIDLQLKLAPTLLGK
ncbi:MAG: HAD-IIIC family phosphatase [Cyanobacteria bacterium P01_F01_bin.3]